MIINNKDNFKTNSFSRYSKQNCSLDVAGPQNRKTLRQKILKKDTKSNARLDGSTLNIREYYPNFGEVVNVSKNWYEGRKQL